MVNPKGGNEVQHPSDKSQEGNAGQPQDLYNRIEQTSVTRPGDKVTTVAYNVPEVGPELAAAHAGKIATLPDDHRAALKEWALWHKAQAGGNTAWDHYISKC
ncbi:MAG TPA: hypothetical protein V6C81_19725 [Planktothrix sp.]|jgi:hypothetical protein